jgi:hypothetical protein
MRQCQHASPKYQYVNSTPVLRRRGMHVDVYITLQRAIFLIRTGELDILRAHWNDKWYEHGAQHFPNALLTILCMYLEPMLI